MFELFSRDAEVEKVGSLAYTNTLDKNKSIEMAVETNFFMRNSFHLNKL